MKKKTSRPLFSIIAYDSKYSMCGLLCLLLGYDEVVFWYGSRSRSNVNATGHGLNERSTLVMTGDVSY